MSEEKNIIFAVLAVIVLVTAVGLVYMIKGGPGRATNQNTEFEGLRHWPEFPTLAPQPVDTTYTTTTSGQQQPPQYTTPYQQPAMGGPPGTGTVGGSVGGKVCCKGTCVPFCTSETVSGTGNGETMAAAEKMCKSSLPCVGGSLSGFISSCRETRYNIVMVGDIPMKVENQYPGSTTIIEHTCSCSALCDICPVTTGLHAQATSASTVDECERKIACGDGTKLTDFNYWAC